MRLKYSLFISALTLTTLLATGLAFAGWGDALKAAGDAGAEAAGLSYTPSEAEAGIKEVLSMGTDSAVSNLGKSGGFSMNPANAIPVPDALKSLGDNAGLMSMFNSAAESSVPSIGGLFNNSINDLDVSNPTSMLGSGSADTAITNYFDQQSRPHLRKLARPIVAESLDAAGAGGTMSAMSTAMQGTGFDPVDYVTDQTLDVMFRYIGEKEKSLRSSGGAGASSLLQKIF